MEWISVKDKLPEGGIRILVFSPVYKPDDVMCFRVVDSQFMRILTEVTHWAYMTVPTPKCPKCWGKSARCPGSTSLLSDMPDIQWICMDCLYEFGDKEINHELG